MIGACVVGFLATDCLITQTWYAYRQTCIDFSKERNQIPGMNEVHRTDRDYAQKVNALFDIQMAQRMLPFLRKVGMREDVIFFPEATPFLCRAYGTTWFRGGDAMIQIDPALIPVLHRHGWFMKHEIGHIQHNDLFTMHAIPVICQIVGSLFAMCFLPVSWSLGSGWVVGRISFFLFSIWREGKADDFAIEHSTTEELEDGREFLNTIRLDQIKKRNTFWSRICFSPSGDNRMDLLHPSLSSRIKKIDQALLLRKATPPRAVV